MARNVRDLIVQGARARGLDPAAVLAVASQEGLSGRIGDQGTSFGPWQLHWGGAYPSHAPQGDPHAAQAWAMSPAGINYALDQIASVAKGLRGQAAVENIVRRFERPADPAGEIAGALRSYGGPLPTGGALAQPAAPIPLGSTQMPRLTNLLPVPNLLSNFNVRLDSDPIAQAQRASQQLLGLSARIPRIQPLPLPAALGMRSPVTTLPFSPATGGAPVRNLMAPATGKLIGTPYSGTHTLGNWESDNAVDVALPYGTPVRAVTSGVIGPQFGSLGADAGSRFAGLRLHLKSKANEWYYAHLSRFAKGIRPGVYVKAGEIIGYSGAANGVNHLHLGQERGDPRSLYGQGS